MKQRTRRIIRKRYLIVKILFQIGIIVGMVLLAMRPLLDGREVKFIVEGRDPRNLFRGNYVELRYAFSTVNLDSIPNDLDPDVQYTFGDELYLELKQRGRFHRAVGLWTKPPGNNLFMKVIVRYHYRSGGGTPLPNPDVGQRSGTPDYSDIVAQKPRRSGQGSMGLIAGIEEYFTTPETARKLERLIGRQDVPDVQVVAYVMVSDDGEARIKKIRYGVIE